MIVPLFDETNTLFFLFWFLLMCVCCIRCTEKGNHYIAEISTHVYKLPPAPSHAQLINIARIDRLHVITNNNLDKLFFNR